MADRRTCARRFGSPPARRVGSSDSSCCNQNRTATFLYVEPRIVRKTVDAVVTMLPVVHRLFAALPGFTKVSFADALLLVLSNGLLDNWQINRVENKYLNVQRLQRAGGRYYYAVFESMLGDPVEPFSIYGNHGQDTGDVTLCLHGNQRYAGPINLVTLRPSDLSRFGFSSGTDIQAAQSELVGDLVRRWHDPTASISEAKTAGLRALRLLTAGGETAIPVLGPRDETGLTEIAAAFAPTLIAILERQREALDLQYRSSPYPIDGVSNSEFFIWWYHIFYTAVTNQLSRRKVIVLPPAVTLTYLIIN